MEMVVVGNDAAVEGGGQATDVVEKEPVEDSRWVNYLGGESWWSGIATDEHAGVGSEDRNGFVANLM